MRNRNKEDEKTSATVVDLSDCKMNNPQLVAQLKMLGFTGSGEGMTFKEAMICSQIANAVKGDERAYRNVMDYAKNDGLMPLEAFLKDNGQ